MKRRRPPVKVWVLMNHTLLPRNDAMHPFLQKHLSSVTGWLNGFDRLRCRGTLRMLSHTGGFASFLRLIGVKIKDFGPFVRETTERVCQASEAVARAAGRPVIYVPSAASNKEEIARQIMERDEVRSGLVCVCCGAWSRASVTTCGSGVRRS